MPREYQKTVSLPKWLYDRAESYYTEHEEELKLMGVTSVTGLITFWVREAIREKAAGRGEAS